MTPGPLSEALISPAAPIPGICDCVVGLMLSEAPISGISVTADGPALAAGRDQTFSTRMLGELEAKGEQALAKRMRITAVGADLNETAMVAEHGGLLVL